MIKPLLCFLIIFITYDACCALVPEVSQEGVLHPYGSYSDVTLLHYHLPQQLATATWEFAAFMDDPSCPQRVVHVLLQHGSYPLVSPNNDTFAPYMYDERSSLYKVSTVTGSRPHDATLLSVESPLPGSWYAAAYIPHWEQEMQQEGLIHKCRYSLGSIAMWRQQENIQTLHPGHKTKVVTRRNLEYYRFYVPSKTWLLRVSLGNCRKLEGGTAAPDGTPGSRWCIGWAALRARALPHYDVRSPGAVNISSGSGHVFLEERPYTDSYYYLLLYTEGQTRAAVAITTRECGGTTRTLHSRAQRSTKSVVEQPEASSGGQHGLQHLDASHGRDSLVSSTQKPILNSPANAISIQHNIQQHGNKKQPVSTKVNKTQETYTSSIISSSLPIASAQLPPVEIENSDNASKVAAITTTFNAPKPVPDIQESDLLQSASQLTNADTKRAPRRQHVVKGYDEAKKATAAGNAGVFDEAEEPDANRSLPATVSGAKTRGKSGYSAGQTVRQGTTLTADPTVATAVYTESGGTATPHRDHHWHYGTAGLDHDDTTDEAEEDGDDEHEDEDEHEFVCYTVLTLARIKHVMDFTNTFLIQGPEWYSTWVNVVADSPVFTHLTLLPHTDIGGTLTIGLHLDPLLQNATHQLVTVEGCARKGRAPSLSRSSHTAASRFTCSPSLSLQATSLPVTQEGGEEGWWWEENGNDAKFRNSKNIILIPFPEPDEWYLGLMVVCYTGGSRTPCSLSEVVVSVEARTQPCLYAGPLPCGPHGTCVETHKGLMAYSSCKCVGGWRGWGCQEPTISPGYSLTGVLLLTLSNGFFLPAIVVALRLKLPSHALLYASTMLASVLYHLCDNQILPYCITRTEVLQFTDFFFSLLCFWVTVVGLASPLTASRGQAASSRAGAPYGSSAGRGGRILSRGGCCHSASGSGTEAHTDGSSDLSDSSSAVHCNHCGNRHEACSSPCPATHSSSVSCVWYTLGVVVIAPCVQYSRTALASFVIPMALAATVPLGSLLCVWWRGGGCLRVGRRVLLWRGVGAVLALTGLAMFALVQTKHNYQYVHSFWHSTIALSLLFFLPYRHSTHLSSKRKHHRPQDSDQDMRQAPESDVSLIMQDSQSVVDTEGDVQASVQLSSSAASPVYSRVCSRSHSRGSTTDIQQCPSPCINSDDDVPPIFTSPPSLVPTDQAPFQRNNTSRVTSTSPCDSSNDNNSNVSASESNITAGRRFLGKLFSTNTRSAPYDGLGSRSATGGYNGLSLSAMTDDSAQLVDIGSHTVDYTAGGVDVRGGHHCTTDDVDLILLNDD